MPSNPGSRYEPLYRCEVQDDGSIKFVEIGKDDLYERIQSYEQSTDIRILLKRFERGDSTALSRVQGFYADMTGAPKSYAQILQSVIDGQAMFDQLPAAVRSEFGGDFFKFFSTMDSPEWMQKVARHVKKPVPGSGSAPAAAPASAPAAE